MELRTHLGLTSLKKITKILCEKTDAFQFWSLNFWNFWEAFASISMLILSYYHFTQFIHPKLTKNVPDYLKGLCFYTWLPCVKFFKDWDLNDILGEWQDRRASKQFCLDGGLGKTNQARITHINIKTSRGNCPAPIGFKLSVSEWVILFSDLHYHQAMQID